MSLQFTGTITEIKGVRTGTTEKGEWANAEFEVTESNPENALYPQVGLFDFFKNGEHVKFAKDFKNFNPVGTVVTVHFNLKKNEYTKPDGTPAKFYKTSAWKVEKQQSEGTPPVPRAEAFQPASDLNEEDHDDLPF